MRALAAIAGVALIAAAGAALAQQKSVIEQRQDLMKGQGAQMKIVTDFLKEGRGSAADVAQAAARLRDSATKIAALFPAGSGMDKNPGKTLAKPEIWTDRAKFEATAKTLETEAAKLETAGKSGDKAQIEAAANAIGRNACGACHQAFRAPKT
jgi:cytochrome c556